MLDICVTFFLSYVENNLVAVKTASGLGANSWKKKVVTQDDQVPCPYQIAKFSNNKTLFLSIPNWATPTPANLNVTNT